MIKIMSSVRVAGLGFAVFVAMGGAALAQDVPARDLPQNGGAGIRSGNITSTGATVPNPGAPQASGTTPLDRGVEQQDNKITGSICKGC